MRGFEQLRAAHGRSLGYVFDQIVCWLAELKPARLVQSHPDSRLEGLGDGNVRSSAIATQSIHTAQFGHKLATCTHLHISWTEKLKP